MSLAPVHYSTNSASCIEAIKGVRKLVRFIVSLWWCDVKAVLSSV